MQIAKELLKFLLYLESISSQYPNEIIVQNQITEESDLLH